VRHSSCSKDIQYLLFSRVASCTRHSFGFQLSWPEVAFASAPAAALFLSFTINAATTRLRCRQQLCLSPSQLRQQRSDHSDHRGLSGCSIWRLLSIHCTEIRSIQVKPFTSPPQLRIFIRVRERNRAPLACPESPLSAKLGPARLVLPITNHKGCVLSLVK